MGQSSGLKAWAVRALLLMILLGTFPRVLHQQPQAPGALLAKAGQVFTKAGYRTELTVDQAWGQITRATEATLIAHSSLCGAAVRVRAVSLANLTDDFQSAAARPETSYAFGDWIDQKVSRVHILIELARLRLRGAFSFGQTPWAKTAMLVIDDPSACMVISPPRTGDIWM
jgi:hypothetical protein